MLERMDALDSLIREALMVCALLCFPILVIATGVGTLVAIVQAATSIQEQTLTLLPKIAAVAIIAVMFGHAGFDMLANLFEEALRRAPDLLRSVS